MLVSKGMRRFHRGCEPPNIGLGNLNIVFFKSSKHFLSFLSYLSDSKETKHYFLLNFICNIFM